MPTSSRPCLSQTSSCISYWRKGSGIRGKRDTSGGAPLKMGVSKKAFVKRGEYEGFDLQGVDVLCVLR